VDLPTVNAPGGDGSDIGAVELSVTIPTTTLTVLNTNDSGAGSLREAIMFANVWPDTNTIVFAPSTYGKITLTSGELPITAPLAILGPGPANVTISGNAASRVFYIGPNLSVTIAGLTIADGANPFGGGIYNDHSILTLSNCTLSGNAAHFGGGIHNHGESGSAALSVSACTFSGNSASHWGGGIYNDGESFGNATLKVLNTTFSANSAYLGGGVENDGFYGSAALSVNACTFSGNSTIYSAGLGGGIYNDDVYGVATLQIGDTILSAGALGGTLQGGTVTSLGYNLSSDNGGGFLTATTDQINTDPKLGPLQDNGGPTFTYALLPGSPAIDKGKRDAVPSLAANTDQRGSPRPADFSDIVNALGGDGSDIGAFEVQLAATVGTPMLLAGPQNLLNGSFQFSFTNTPGASFTVLTATNIALPLSNWTVLGTPTEITPGNFQYADPQATNQPQRFYGIRSP
jgi:predicted outer membrane repeat protein